MHMYAYITHNIHNACKCMHKNTYAYLCIYFVYSPTLPLRGACCYFQWFFFPVAPGIIPLSCWVRPALRKAGRALGVGLGGSKKRRKMKVLRMKFSIVENVPTPRGIIFKLCTASQLPYRAKSKFSAKQLFNYF